MQALKIKYFLIFAAIMFVSKPFLGFSVQKQSNTGHALTILAKAFTKRKQEFVDNSEFDIATVYKQLAKPLSFLTVLFSLFLNRFFPVVINSRQLITNGLLSAIGLSLCPPQNRYLLAGKLII